MSIKKIKESLKDVIDPELGVNIVDLGLVYGISLKDKTVKIKVTMTTPLCPLFPVIEKNVKEVVGSLSGVENVEIELVWEPPWSPKRMSENAKLQLGLVK